MNPLATTTRRHVLRMEPIRQKYLDGLLAEPDRHALERHVAECDLCRSCMERSDRAERALREVRPQPAPLAPSVADELYRRAVAASTGAAPVASRSSRHTAFGPFSAVGTVGVAAGIALAAYLSRPAAVRPEPKAPVASPKILARVGARDAAAAPWRGAVRRSSPSPVHSPEYARTWAPPAIEHAWLFRKRRDPAALSGRAIDAVEPADQLPCALADEGGGAAHLGAAATPDGGPVQPAIAVTVTVADDRTPGSARAACLQRFPMADGTVRPCWSMASVSGTADLERSDTRIVTADLPADPLTLLWVEAIGPRTDTRLSDREQDETR